MHEKYDNTLVKAYICISPNRNIRLIDNPLFQTYQQLCYLEVRHVQTQIITSRQNTYIIIKTSKDTKNLKIDTTQEVNTS